eukprot:CAMPEP_0117070254 /NCGR_PEP_ID=MMETSP0472-20121206/49363_1 /TAXON_ID=693140 ORGANISM="Tiarina fusus, Strain LIS" /NCGR_SAMPLE_ID=MMETSP0472 /ASSEMBLY_ACC=CAM_ASM_000603 /LENGTH=240 /DNA_ID=CAMNT_0004793297 /DNA_START=125 /DNA_END=844 /DNA_ORIENTATION=+
MAASRRMEDDMRSVDWEDTVTVWSMDSTISSVTMFTIDHTSGSGDSFSTLRTNELSEETHRGAYQHHHHHHYHHHQATGTGTGTSTATATSKSTSSESDVPSMNRDMSPTSVSDLGRKNIRRFASASASSREESSNSPPRRDTIPVIPRRDTIPVIPRRGDGSVCSDQSSEASSTTGHNTTGSCSNGGRRPPSAAAAAALSKVSSKKSTRTATRRKSLPAIQESQPQYAPVVMVDGAPCD